MKKLFVISTLLIFVFVNNVFGQVVIGQPPVQQQPQQQQPNQQVYQQQNAVNQQNQQVQLTPDQIKQQTFNQYVHTFFPDAEPNWVGSHTIPDTITTPIKGYKIIRIINGQPSVEDYLIPKGAIVARYHDQTTDEYYYTLGEGAYLVRTDRYNAIAKIAQQKAEEQKKLAEKTEKQNKKNAKKMARKDRTPEEKAMVLQKGAMIGQGALNLFERIFFMVKASKAYNGNSGYYSSSYSGGAQTINW